MSLKPGIFITGTDTNVGKTVIAAGLALALREKGLRVGVMKPVATGCFGVQDRLISSDAVYLWEAAENEYPKLTCPSRFKNPLAPQVAASLEQKTVDVDDIYKSYQKLQKHYDFIIVEGVGGLMVPLTENYFVSNLIRDFQLPLVVVSRPGLGAINHTLLTVDAAMVRGFDIKGIIFNRVPQSNLSLAEITNPKIIHEITQIPILGSLPEIDDLDVDSCKFGSLQEIFEERIRIDKIVPNPAILQ